MTPMIRRPGRSVGRSRWSGIWRTWRGQGKRAFLPSPTRGKESLTPSKQRLFQRSCQCLGKGRRQMMPVAEGEFAVDEDVAFGRAAEAVGEVDIERVWDAFHHRALGGGHVV